MNAEDIIARCTRDGVTAWSHVARQLGRSVDSVRAQFDPGYERAYVWAPSREPIPPAAPEDLIDPAIDENDTSSPYAKGPGLKAEILQLLAAQSMSAETLASMLNRPVNSIRARLDRLMDAGKVWHDGAYPRTWGIMEEGGTRRAYASEVIGLSSGFNQDVHLSWTRASTIRQVVNGGQRKFRP